MSVEREGLSQVTLLPVDPSFIFPINEFNSKTLVVFDDGFHRVKLFISSESHPWDKLLIPLQQVYFHIADFVPIKHNQHIGLWPAGGVLLQWALFSFNNASSTALKTVFSNVPSTVLDIFVIRPHRERFFPAHDFTK